MAITGQLAVETVKLGLKNLRLHKLRSLLTMLGIIFGVGAVICMLSISEGRSASQLQLIHMLGAKNVIVKSVQPPEQADTGGSDSSLVKYGITSTDLDRIKATVPQVERVVAMREVAFRLSRGARQYAGVVLATDPAYFEVVKLLLSSGRMLNREDERAKNKACVLGADVAKRLFSFEDPMGKTITVVSHSGSQPLTVVGVLASVETAGTPRRGIAQRNTNREVYMPFATGFALFGTTTVIARSGSSEQRQVEYTDLYIAVTEDQYVKDVSEMVRQIMMVDHTRPDYTISVPLELLMQIEAEKRNRQLILGIIAGVSLIVAGIGIMNIMLATVTERTREIGIRRALGAKQRQIAQQFLVETLVLTMAGGALGVAAGIGGAVILTHLASWPTIITLWSVTISVGVAAIVGVFFGMYPALAAAKLDPIEALRHE